MALPELRRRCGRSVRLPADDLGQVIETDESGSAVLGQNDGITRLPVWQRWSHGLRSLFLSSAEPACRSMWSINARASHRLDCQ